ncbi:MAG: hypothetical protein K2X81_26885 [Candidatus Obscuribacterales bacterium]|nr:hypothetical protein [Candidatus Obscuribacterales bacterium]
MTVLRNIVLSGQQWACVGSADAAAQDGQSRKSQRELAEEMHLVECPFDLYRLASASKETSIRCFRSNKVVGVMLGVWSVFQDLSEMRNVMYTR